MDCKQSEITSTNRFPEVIMWAWSDSLLFCLWYPVGRVRASWGKKISASKYKRLHNRSIFRISEYISDNIAADPERWVKTCSIHQSKSIKCPRRLTDFSSELTCKSVYIYILPSGDKVLVAPIHWHWLSWNPVKKKVISKRKGHQGKRQETS